MTRIEAIKELTALRLGLEESLNYIVDTLEKLPALTDEQWKLIEPVVASLIVEAKEMVLG